MYYTAAEVVIVLEPVARRVHPRRVHPRRVRPRQVHLHQVHPHQMVVVLVKVNNEIRQETLT